MIGFGFVPIIALLLIVLLYARTGCDWTESIVLGSIVWLFAISLSTEAISLANAIGFPRFAWAWGAGLVVLVALHASVSGLGEPPKLRHG